MTIPNYQVLMLPVLKLIATGHETIPSCLEPLRSEFAISENEFEELLPSGKQTVLANRAHWARNYMSQAGLVEPIKRGHYRLTQEGEALLANPPQGLNADYLKRYDRFLEFLQRSSTTQNDNSNDAKNADSKSEASTPEDLMAKSHREIEALLRNDLLEAVLSVSPARFEQLIVDLLVTMGYGGGDSSMGKSIGKSGDGGIDGVINEDALGLDAVYVQAKRYDPSNKVGRPDIQKFVGSLTGESATKGVFVTTSAFSREAQDYISRVQQRIILIDGEMLARLMIQYGVGVRARAQYVIRSIDEDYFPERET